MIYVGLFFVGITSAAFAALHIPKKKPSWGKLDVPKVKTYIHVNGERNDY